MNRFLQVNISVKIVFNDLNNSYKVSAVIPILVCTRVCGLTPQPLSFFFFSQIRIRHQPVPVLKTNLSSIAAEVFQHVSSLLVETQLPPLEVFIGRSAASTLPCGDLCTYERGQPTVHYGCHRFAENNH